MGFPAAELYFTDAEPSPAKPVQQTLSPTFVEASPEPLLKDKVKVIGIGGGGRNALNHIISSGADHVGFLAVDTDVRNLEKSGSPNKIILGKRGIGAGCIPKNGEDAARESLGEIIDFMRGSDMVYLTAGMGGGTGTGAIPVIAEAARNLGILTVAVVTKPFSFEGAKKMRIAAEGIEKLRSVVDALIVIPNQKLLETSDFDTSIPEAFAMADEVLRQAVLGVTELITRPGMVNMDFADVKAVMRKSGIAVMGTGCASGDNRIQEALNQAMNSPLMETQPTSASGFLMNISSANTLTLFELQQAAQSIEDCIGEDATFVWGTTENPELGKYIKITIIATGVVETPVQKTAKKTVIKQVQTVKAAQMSGLKNNPAQTIQPVMPVQQVLPKTEPVARTAVQAAQPVPRAVFSEKKEEFLTVTLPPRSINTDTAEPFLPAWLRNKDRPVSAPQTVTEEKPENEDLFAETYNKRYDTPSFIRRKKTAPEID